MPEVREEVINVRLAEILSRDFGIDARAERVKGRRRPDIRCYYRGFIVGIEASYDRSDAEERIRQELADVALVLGMLYTHPKNNTIAVDDRVVEDPDAVRKVAEIARRTLETCVGDL